MNVNREANYKESKIYPGIQLPRARREKTMMPVTSPESVAAVKAEEFDLSFKVFYELMANKVSDILLVSSPYDAFIMEEEGRLAERIIHEYRGLNLSRPPMLTWVSSARQALNALSRKKFDFVITMPRLNDTDAVGLGRKIKRKFPYLPVFLMTHNSSRIFLDPEYQDRNSIDKSFVWYGNSDLLLALVKSVEDCWNIAHDTHRARVRVVIIVEDSPIYYSRLLPVLYRVIVTQTYAVMEGSINDEHRLLMMRARPKILHARNYEEAEELYRQYKPYLLSVLSDVRFPRKGKLDADAGYALLSMIRKENPDIPLLNLSSEEGNRERSLRIPAVFLNKNSPSLVSEIRRFFIDYLGFGDFVFRRPDGSEVDRAANLRSMERILPEVPDDSIFFHAVRNHFSTWLMARSEIKLASALKPVKATDFENAAAIRDFLVDSIRKRRKDLLSGAITDFSPEDFDPDAGFVKIGKGSLGGKARGLAFLTTQLKKYSAIHQKYPDVVISVPKTLVISTEGFDTFMEENDLKDKSFDELSDQQINDMFFAARFPVDLRRALEIFLSHADYPLAVRSSSLLEDAQFQPFAGIYKTFMIPNNHPDNSVRLRQLIQAVKLVYASTYLEKPRAYTRSTMHRTEDEKMAVVIQQLNGIEHSGFYYPAVSGVAQSYNFYPISHLKPEEGIAHIALGLGKTVVEGGTALRFSPRYPEFLPQFSSVDDVLKNSQRSFFALRLNHTEQALGARDVLAEDAALVKLDVDSAGNHSAVQMLSSCYMAEDHRIRDTHVRGGYPVLTFARLLKHRFIPLPEMLMDVLKLVRRGMGCPVEMEFAVNLQTSEDRKAEFCILQIRPMAINQHNRQVAITEWDIRNAFCYSTRALGHGVFQDVSDVVYVNPDTFDASQTLQIAQEIGSINANLVSSGRKYLLAGPGRWGSADRWLGIPVSWKDISGVGTIIEAKFRSLHADPSQGTHFFHNITSLGINYITVFDADKDFIQWEWMQRLPAESETRFVRHIRLPSPLTIKVDGKTTQAVMLADDR